MTLRMWLHVNVVSIFAAKKTNNVQKLSISYNLLSFAGNRNAIIIEFHSGRFPQKSPIEKDGYSLGYKKRTNFGDKS